MGETGRLFTHDQIQDFATRWFQTLDRHAPSEDLKEFLAEDALEVVFPQDRFIGFDSFRAWYEGAVHTFFDECHTLKHVALEAPEGDRQAVKIVVNWQCRTWTPPEPYSKHVDMDAYQTWVLHRRHDGQPQVVRYVVDDVRYGPGSVTL